MGWSAFYSQTHTLLETRLDLPTRSWLSCFPAVTVDLSRSVLPQGGGASLGAAGGPGAGTGAAAAGAAGHPAGAGGGQETGGDQVRSAPGGGGEGSDRRVRGLRVGDKVAGSASRPEVGD